MAELMRIAGRGVDLSHPDVVFLVDCVAELERELANANEYLEHCRQAAGAHEGEMLIDAIRRQLPARHRAQNPYSDVGRQ
jgi:hypothetical protein